MAVVAGPPTAGAERESSATNAFLALAVDRVLAEQGDPGLLAEVGALHDAALRLRQGDPRPLEEAVGALGDDELLSVARACTMHLAMENVADDLRRLRRRQRSDAEASAPLHESLRQVAGAVAEAGGPPTLDIRLVLTAHPSDIARRSVLSKRRTVATCLEALDDPHLGIAERRRLEDEVCEALAIWYATNEVRSMRPRVSDEVRRMLFFFESVVVDAAAELAVEAERTLGLTTPSIRFGSWAGGDMDGNPHVSGETVLDTLRAHRELALRLLLDRVERLRQVYSQAARPHLVGERLRASLERDARELPDTAAFLQARYPHEEGEPLRRKLSFVAARLRHLLEEPGRPEEPGYASPDDLLADLEDVRDSLGSAIVASGRLARLEWQVRIFGFHLATLEVRDNAPELQAAAAELLPGYAEAASEDERIALLTAACLDDNLAWRGEAPRSRVAGTFEALGRAVERYGSAALDTFIVSNTEQPSDLLCALWLAAANGLADRLELVPLFERGRALAQAEETMAALYANPAYARHLDARGRRQDVMVGYSDAGKDEGFAAAQWTIYRAQELLAQQARACGVDLRLFHGRGGSPSRGGGPAYRSVLAQPPGTVRGRIKITEQGEVITAKFSDERAAPPSLEQTLAAVVRTTVTPGPPPPATWREELDRVASTARRAYRALVVDDPDFLLAFEQCTPISVLGDLNIGSRPASRSKKQGVADLRAIPWVFAWTQSRIGMPSWYGAGSALAGGDLELQREMWDRWPFFHNLVTTLEKALAASDLTAGERYLVLADPRAPAERIWAGLRAEHERCVGRVLAITGHERLLAPSADALARHERRLPWLDALSFLQVELIRRDREGRASAREALLTTIAGIATGLRTTG